METGVKFDGGFKMLAPKLSTSWDPSMAGMPTKPSKPSHRTVTLGVIMSDRGAIGNGMLTTGTLSNATGHFAVADNSFPAVAELVLGNHRLINTIDYAVGTTATLTAVNIAASISKLAGWVATSALAVVTVKYNHQADDVEFRVVHHGGVVSFNAFTGGGYLTKGVPSVGPPVLA